MKNAYKNIRAFALAAAVLTGALFTATLCAQQAPAPKAANLEEIAEKNFDKALEASKADGKIAMLEFTGSQWCPPCKMLHKFVLNTEEFVDFAKKNLHVIVLDFERSGTPVDKENAVKYEALAQKYRIEGFPTIILIHPKTGEVKKYVGLQFRNPQSLINEIKSFKGN